MKISLKAWQKILIVLICFAVAIVGFMIKLPPGFRHIDKQLHAAFYFGAAAIVLYLFGMAIEYSQEYSNRFFRRRIHGRFDPEDVQSNLNGLVAFSLLWIVCIIIILVYKKASLKKQEV